MKNAPLVILPTEPQTMAPAACHTLSVPATAVGIRLDVWLAETLPELSRARLQALIHAGQISVNGQPAKASSRIQAGHQVTVRVPTPIAAIPQPESMALNIVFEDADIVVLNKPAGLVVHPAPGHSHGTLVNGLLHHCDDLAGIGGVERPGIVHRLDKDTSGLMVIAKHDAAMAALVQQFLEKGVRKEYLAVVHGAPVQDAGTINAPIGRHTHDRQRMAVVPERGKSAVTHYHVITRFATTCLIRARIETGRTHQIRVHLTHIGLPIVGDQVYGRTSRDRLLPDCPARQMLHAERLAFTHPISGVALDFKRPPPADMRRLITHLRKDARLLAARDIRIKSAERTA